MALYEIGTDREMVAHAFCVTRNEIFSELSLNCFYVKAIATFKCVWLSHWAKASNEPIGAYKRVDRETNLR